MIMGTSREVRLAAKEHQLASFVPPKPRPEKSRCPGSQESDVQSGEARTQGGSTHCGHDPFIEVKRRRSFVHLLENYTPTLYPIDERFASDERWAHEASDERWAQGVIAHEAVWDVVHPRLDRPGRFRYDHSRRVGGMRSTDDQWLWYEGCFDRRLHD